MGTRKRMDPDGIREVLEARALMDGQIDSEGFQVENLRDLETSVPDLVDQEILAGIVRDSLEILPPKQRQIIERRYGLNGYREATQEEVADSFGDSRSNCYQHEKTAKDRLRRHLLAIGIGREGLV